MIGTHALIEEKVEFDRLGLVVVDEQHRFGVLQRFKLMKKPNQPEPDVLVMTATPIPRTLALSLYGDLDLSVLDELPPGRTPIVTRRVPGERQTKCGILCASRWREGRQAYIVYPVIEGTKDDQPELDFSHDEPEANAEKLEIPPGLRAEKRQKRKTTRELFPKGGAGGESKREIRAEVSGGDVREAAHRAAWPGCALACCTGGSTRTRKKSSCAASSAAKSMCWWPPR